MAAQEDNERDPSQEHIECIPTFRTIPLERQLRANCTASAQQRRKSETAWRRLGNGESSQEAEECSRIGGTSEHHCLCLPCTWLAQVSALSMFSGSHSGLL